MATLATRLQRRPWRRSAGDGGPGRRRYAEQIARAGRQGQGDQRGGYPLETRPIPFVRHPPDSYVRFTWSQIFEWVAYRKIADGKK
jgi:hypothetical protein